jgi:CSLREA domain-containing protein
MLSSATVHSKLVVVRIVVAAVCLMTAGHAAAATFVVDSTADAVDAAPGNGVCATATATCTLRAAVQEANALKGDQSVTLPSGTYALTLGGLTVIDVRLTVTGAGARTTTITRNGVGLVFTLTRGELHASDVTVTNAAGAGCFRATSGRLSLTRAVVNACGGNGVAAHVDFFSIDSVTLDVTDSAITNNGGGLSLSNAVAATVTRSIIAGNSAPGGVRVAGMDGFNHRGVLTVIRSRIENNSAQRGGGIFADSAFSVDIVDSTIAGNLASSGGGIYATTFSDDGPPAYLSVLRSTIAQNSATGADGGAGLYIGPPRNTRGVEPRVRIVNSTISGNGANSGGGGAFTIEETGTASLTNVTIARNSSATGGAIHEKVRPDIEGEPADVWIRNTIVAENGPANCALASALIDLGHNLEFPGTSCGLVLASDRHADPLLAPLANYGGPTPTHALPQNSPAVDAADTGTCAASPVSGVDQRGFVRPAACDIGAYEARAAGPPFSDTSLTPGATVIRAIHVVELRGRIDALRVQFGPTPFAWTDASLSDMAIEAVHIQQMRDVLVAAYTAAIASGVSVLPPSFTDDPLVAGQTIKAAHVEELRSAVVTLESQ